MARTISLPLDTGNFVPTPTAPTVTPATAGVATWGYKLVAEAADGTLTDASPEGTTMLGAASLSMVNNNVVTWTDPANLAKMHIFRSTDATSPTTLGYIGVVNAGVQTFTDTGLAGDGSTAPSVNLTTVSRIVPVSDLRDLTMQLAGTWSATLKLQGKIDPTGLFSDLFLTDFNGLSVSVSAGGIYVVEAGMISSVRLVATSFTSGTIVAAIGGHA